MNEESKLRSIIREEIKTVKDMGGPAIMFETEAIDVDKIQFKQFIDETLKDFGLDKASNVVVDKNDVYIFFDATVSHSEIKMSVLDAVLKEYDIDPRNYKFSASR